MKQLLQSLSTGDSDLPELPTPVVGRGHLLISTSCSLVSAGTERMLVDFGKANLLDKARQQPDKVQQVLDKARTEGIAGRLAEVKIRYTGFETHTHGRSIPVAMDDTDVFLRQVRRLFAENVHQEEKIRLIGFRLGQLEELDTRQTTLAFDEESE